MLVIKKSILSTAIKAALIGAITIPMVGCDDAETETYNQQEYQEAQANYTQQQRQQLVGNVQGVVLDSNGNPLEGANVSIGTQTTTTDSLGYYAFADVAAVNVVKNGDDTGLNSENTNGLVALPIEVSVSADGHLGGRTQVYPTAISDTTQYVYIDGFTAQAKNLYLPELDASVKATLRSEITGEAIANKKVTFEFISLNNSELGEFESLASQAFSVVTDANGAFVATGLPANSSFQVLVEDYRVDGQYVLDEAGKTVASNFTTSDEPIVSNWGEIFVTEQIVADLIKPFVRNIQYVTSSVTGTGLSSVYKGYLAKGKDGTSADGGLVFELSESVSILNRQSNGSLDDNTVKVLRILGDESAEYLGFTTTQSSGDVNSIQINLNTALEPGEEIEVYFEIEDFVDANANRLTTEGVNAIAVDDVATLDVDESNPYHRVADDIGEGAKSNYIRYNITAYKPATDLGAIGSVAQNNAADITTFNQLSLHNAAFKGHGDYDQDSDAGTSEVSQINSAANANTGALLAELAAELTQASGIAAPDKVFINTAEIEVKLPLDTVSVEVLITANGVENINATAALQTLVNAVNFETANLAEKMTFIVKGVTPGENVKLIPKDGFGVANEGKAVNTNLVDNIAPTAILQDSYDVIDNDISGDGEYRVSGSSLGGDYTIDGGSRVTVEEQGELGFPYLAITPSILNIDDKKADVSGDLVNNGVGNDDGENVYDGDDYDAWSVKSVTTAIAFSETVQWSGSVPTQSIVASGVTSNLLTNFALVSNTAANSDSDNPHGFSQAQDFVIFDVDNLFTFANDNDGEKISFNDRLKDTSGNAASAAIVVIQDKLPPMIASAELTGDEGDFDSQELVISFSETVFPKSNYTADEDASVFRLHIAGNTYSTDVSLDASDIDFSGDTITIEIKDLTPIPTFEEGQKITDLKVHIADENGNEGDTQFGDELATTFNYNHVSAPVKTLMFKVENKITAP